MSEGREVQERVVGRGNGQGEGRQGSTGPLLPCHALGGLSEDPRYSGKLLGVSGKASHAYWAQGWPAWVALETSCARPGAALGCTGVLGSSAMISGIL